MSSTTHALKRPEVIRYLGLAGAVLLATDAYLFGAYATIRTGVSPVSIARGPYGPAVLVLWAAGVAAMATAWWYGRHLVGRGILTARWVLGTAVLWMVPFALAPPTGSRDVYAYACQGALYASGHNPYLVGVAAQPCPWLDSVSPIWRDTPSPYGPVFLMLAGLAARAGGQVAAIVVFRALAVAGVVLVAAAMPVLARRVGVPVDRALWIVLACPLMAWHVVGGAHNDALTVGFLVAGLAVLAPPPRGRGSAPRAAALIAGGVLIGVAIAIKVTLGVVLPFAALFAAGAPELPALRIAAQRAGTVLVAALGTLVAFSYGSGLGLGWVGALSHAGDSVAWTSPTTAVGLAVDYLGRLVGVQPHAVPVARTVALVALPIVLLLILWHSRNHNPLYGGGLAMLAIIFLAPITQPWYLLWPLAMFAATNVSARWLAGTVVVALALILPDGTSIAHWTQLPMSFAMSALVGWTLVRGWSWMRGFEPKEIDFEALRREASVDMAAATPR